jgi:hypothetical protein
VRGLTSRSLPLNDESPNHFVTTQPPPCPDDDNVPTRANGPTFNLSGAYPQDAPERICGFIATDLRRPIAEFLHIASRNYTILTDPGVDWGGNYHHYDPIYRLRDFMIVLQQEEAARKKQARSGDLDADLRAAFEGEEAS